MIEQPLGSSCAPSLPRLALCWGLLASVLLAVGAQAGPSLPHHGSHIQGTYVHPQAHTQVQTGPSDGQSSGQGAETLELHEIPNRTETSGHQCPLAERHYRKSLLITAFPRREPTAGKGGSLYQAEQQLPELVGEKLAQSGQLWRYQQLPRSLPQAGTKPAKRAQQVRQLAQQTDTQLILTGELLDMELAHTRDVYAPDPATRGRNSLVSGLRLNPDWDTRQREFVLNLELLDGITGEPVFERQYRARGVWNPRHPSRAGFGSASFWETHYGEQIARTLDQATEELSEAVRCQPLTSRLSSQRRGQTLMLHSGAGQGLQPGDRLPLYRLVQRAIPGLYSQYSAHLVDSGQRITVTETHRDHSVVRLESDIPLSGAHVTLTPTMGNESVSQR